MIIKELMIGMYFACLIISLYKVWRREIELANYYLIWAVIALLNWKLP